MLNESTLQKLHPGALYHIYNRGNNKEILFKEGVNYHYFLKLWKKYIHPVAETFCYILLSNHFHFFIRIRTYRVVNGNEMEPLQDLIVSRSFSNLFNAYAKAINKKYKRTGSLFQERFRRKLVDDDAYFTSLIGYILTNAQKHGFCNSVEAYPHSAYHALVSDKPTNLLREELLAWFGGREAFISFIRSYRAKPGFSGKILEREEED